MRTLKLKTICKDDGTLPVTVLANPAAPLGDNLDASIQIRAIKNIPDDVSDFEVIRRFNETADCTWLGTGTPRYEFELSELGTGRIIK